MRERAAEADVVIVNHHLLCADASVRQGDFGEVIPECELAVIDEAHQLEDVVTQYFGVSLSTYRVEEFVRDAGQAVGLLAGGDEKLGAAFIAATLEVQAAARRLFDQARFELGRAGGDRATLTAGMAGRLQDAGAALEEALTGLVALLARQSELTEDQRTVGTRAADMR